MLRLHGGDSRGERIRRCGGLEWWSMSRVFEGLRRATSRFFDNENEVRKGNRKEEGRRSEEWRMMERLIWYSSRGCLD